MTFQNDIKKVIILGHSGFIGSSLEGLLLKGGNWEVIGRSLPDVDLTDFNSTKQLVEHFTKDSVIVFTAAVKRQFGDTLEVFRKNMVMVENVCHLLESNPVKRVVFFSSAAVYGEETENLNINEQTTINPTSFYGVAKYSAERLLKKVCLANQQTSLVCLRPPLIYGPGDRANTYGPSGFCAAALTNQQITLWGDGTELREFIYIEDICRLIMQLIKTNFEGELNVVSGNSYCFADIINLLKLKFPDLTVSSRPRSKQKANNAFDPSKIKSLLPADFQFTSLEDGLSKIIAQNYR